MNYHWPGNIRELENAIEHAFVLCTGDRIDLLDLPEEIRWVDPHNALSSHPKMLQKSAPRDQKLNRDALLELLTNCDWNKAEVARRVGLSRASIWKYMKKWGIPNRKPTA
jgi:transcriptional regulator of acetoin/glycerol metabolism